MKKYLIGTALLILGLAVAPKLYATVTLAFRASGVQMPTNATTPIASTKQGIWNDTATTPNLRFDDGTNSNYVAAIPATTKGDIPAFTGTNWTRVAAGSNGLCLTAQSGQASGLLWAACGSGGGAGTLQQTYTAGSAGQQIVLQDSTRLGVSLEAYAGESANVFEVQNSSGTPNFAVSPKGLLILAPTIATTGSPTLLTVTGPAHTTLTASTEAIDINLNLNRTVQFATGALTTQRAVYLQAPTYAFAGASTITNAATFTISGAPTAGTNATITNNYALWIAGGASRFDGNIVSGNATLTLKSGETSNGTDGIVLDTSVDYNNGSGFPFQIKNNGASLFNIDTGTFGGGYTEFTMYRSGSVIGGLSFLSGVFQPSANLNFQPHTDNTNTLGTSTARWAQVWSFQHAGVVQTIPAAASITIAPASGEAVRITLSATANTSLAFGAGLAGEVMTVEIIQDGTGGRTITAGASWTGVKLAGGAYTATATASKRDVLTFRYDSTDSTWVEMSRAMNL